MYYKRVLDNVLNEQLKTCGAVEIVGAKWCGKSTTAMQQSKSSVFLQDQKTQMQVRQVFENAPEVLLDGCTPRLIDEWQTRLAFGTKCALKLISVKNSVSSY